LVLQAGAEESYVRLMLRYLSEEVLPGKRAGNHVELLATLLERPAQHFVSQGA
jgi:hypothetical protein